MGSRVQLRSCLISALVDERALELARKAKQVVGGHTLITESNRFEALLEVLDERFGSWRPDGGDADDA